MPAKLSTLRSNYQRYISAGMPIVTTMRAERPASSRFGKPLLPYSMAKPGLQGRRAYGHPWGTCATWMMAPRRSAAYPFPPGSLACLPVGQLANCMARQKQGAEG